MATTNPFDLLGDDDAEDPIQLIAAQQKLEKPKTAPAPASASVQANAKAAAARPAKPAGMPTKPPPPAQAVREANNEAGRGGGRGGGRGYGRGYGRGRSGGGFNRDQVNDENTFGNKNGFSGGYRHSEEGDKDKPSERRGYVGPRGSFRGGRRGGLDNGEVVEGERPRRAFERHSGTGRGNEFKRDGAGRGNWGTPTDEIAPETEEPANEEKNENVSDEKQHGEEDAVDVNKETPANEPEEKEPVDKEMTLEEYEKVLEEKRKALRALKTQERKVDGKEFQSMQQISSKKGNDDVFIKLGSEKDKRKDAADKEERAKKSVSINEFLKPAEGERYHSGGRGRGRGRGSRGGYSGGNTSSNVAAPSIEDRGHFPSLSAK